MQWYYTIQGRREGPVDDNGLDELARRGVIGEGTFVWREGLADWQPYAAARPARITQPPVSPPPRPFSAPVRPAMPSAASSADMTDKFFYYPVLRALSDGRVIRRLVVWGLKIGAVSWVLTGLVALIAIIKLSMQLPAIATVGGVLFAVIVLATTLCIGQVYWYRAASVEELKSATFTVIPIVSILFRMAGETYGTAGIGIGVGACLFMWLSSSNPAFLLGPFGTLVPSMPVDSAFLGGLVILIYAVVVSFLFLVFMYFLAELTVLLADMAMSLQRLVKKDEA